MKTIPKHLNSKKDYLNIVGLSGWQQRFQDLLDSRFIWVEQEVLQGEEGGVTDEAHKVIQQEDGFTQYVLTEDQNAKVFKLGFTVEEVQAILAD